MSVDKSKSYKPHKDFVNETKESVVDLNLNENTELWLLNFPLVLKGDHDVLTDINGKEISLKLHKNGAVASFEGASGRAYDFISHASVEPEETVFISSATESKIAGKISRRVSVVHYPDPKELEKISSNAAKQVYNGMTRTTTYFSRASATKSSRLKSSLSELPEQSNTPKGKPDVNKSNRKPVRELSRGYGSGVSALSSEQSHGGKSKKRKQKE